MPIIAHATADAIAAGKPGPYYSIDDGGRQLGQVNGAPVKIVRFTDRQGRPRYGLTVEGQPDQGKYERATDWCRDPTVYWTAP